MTNHVSDDRLLDHATGQLDALTAAAVEAHVRDCADCARHLDETRTICRLLPADAVEPRPGFDTRLHARLDAIDAESVAPVWRWRWRWALLPSAAAAAGLALVLSASPGTPPETSRTTLPVEPALLADLELLEALDAVELLDVVDDLDVIESLPEEEG